MVAHSSLVSSGVRLLNKSSPIRLLETAMIVQKSSRELSWHFGLVRLGSNIGRNAWYLSKNLGSRQLHSSTGQQHNLRGEENLRSLRGNCYTSESVDELSSN